MYRKLWNTVYIRLFILLLCITNLLLNRGKINLLLVIIAFFNTFLYDELTLIMSIIVITVVLIKILLLKIKIEYKIPIIACIIAVYGTNLKIGLTICKILIQSPKQNNNVHALNVNTKTITKLYNQIFDLHTNFHRLTDKPTIYVCNYTYDRMDNIAWLLIPRSVCCIMGEYLVPVFGRIVKHVIGKKGRSGSFNLLKETIKDKMSNGFSILTYVTTPQEKIGNIGRVRTGIFRIAKELNMTITPIAIDYIHYTNIGNIPYQRFEMRVGDSFNVTDVIMDTLRTRRFFKNSLIEFNKNKFN